jgi:hypothetical protein
VSSRLLVSVGATLRVVRFSKRTPSRLREDGPSAGQSWVYFLSPWGMQLELVSYPDGKAYERGASRLLWHPALPDG